MNELKRKLSSFFLLDEEDGMDLDKLEEDSKASEKSKKPTENYIANKSSQSIKKSGGENVVAINQKQAIQKPQISIVEPRLYSEVQEISDYLLNGQSVIVNFRRMDNEQAKKMIDFLMGVTYAIKGDIQRLGEELFVCTPQSVKINGSDLSDYKESLV